jgi:hypothetical protein
MQTGLDPAAQARGALHRRLLILTAILTVRSGWSGFFIVVSFGYSRELLTPAKPATKEP